MRYKLCLIVILLALTWSCQKDEQVILPEESAEALTMRGNDAFPKILPLPDGFQPEGITMGKGTDFYVGSTVDGSIYKGDLRTGEGGVLVPGQPPRKTYGLSFDHRSNLLFATGGLAGNAFVYDTESGENISSIQFVANPLATPTMVNDVVVTREAAYFTDCFRPFLYKVPLGPAGELPNPITFEEIFLGGDFVMVPTGPLGGPWNANGIDATPDGMSLVLVNLSLGTLYKVDPATGDARLIDLGGESVVLGDGILLDGFRLYVVRNFINMIAVIQLSPDLLSGVVTGAITDPNFDIPTTIGKYGSSIYAVNLRYEAAPPPDKAYWVTRVEKP